MQWDFTQATYFDIYHSRGQKPNILRPVSLRQKQILNQVEFVDILPEYYHRKKQILNQVEFVDILPEYYHSGSGKTSNK